MKDFTKQHLMQAYLRCAEVLDDTRFSVITKIQGIPYTFTRDTITSLDTCARVDELCTLLAAELASLKTTVYLDGYDAVDNQWVKWERNKWVPLGDMNLLLTTDLVVRNKHADMMKIYKSNPLRKVIRLQPFSSKWEVCSPTWSFHSTYAFTDEPVKVPFNGEVLYYKGLFITRKLMFDLQSTKHCTLWQRNKLFRTREAASES